MFTSTEYQRSLPPVITTVEFDTGTSAALMLCAFTASPNNTIAPVVNNFFFMFLHVSFVFEILSIS